jgi:hypothetical protein
MLTEFPWKLSSWVSKFGKIFSTGTRMRVGRNFPKVFWSRDRGISGGARKKYPGGPLKNDNI